MNGETEWRGGLGELDSERQKLGIALASSIEMLRTALFETLTPKLSILDPVHFEISLAKRHLSEFMQWMVSFRGEIVKLESSRAESRRSLEAAKEVGDLVLEKWCEKREQALSEEIERWESSRGQASKATEELLGLIQQAEVWLHRMREMRIRSNAGRRIRSLREAIAAVESQLVGEDAPQEGPLASEVNDELDQIERRCRELRIMVSRK